MSDTGRAIADLRHRPATMPNQTYDAAAYRDLMLSYTPTQMMLDSDRLGLLDDIESLVRNDFAGCVTRPLDAHLTTAICR